MKKIVFADLKNNILEALEKSAEESGICETICLVDGFSNDPVTRELTDSLVVGGPRVPMIMVIGEKSGRVYLFALKILLPDLDL